MKNVTVYMGPMCAFCDAAKRLLTKKNIPYKEINVALEEDKMEEMIKKSNGKRTIPQIFIEDYHVGGYVELRALENKGDINSMSWSTQNTFLMTLNQGKITASNKLAVDVQSNILYNLKGKYKYIKDNGVKKGPFWVLVGVQMPSILIEIGYISHFRESIRLYNSSYQNLVLK